MMLGFLFKKLSDKTDDMTFWEHADALRLHLIRAILAIFVLSIAAFFFKDFLFGTVIMGPAKTDFFSYRLLCRIGNYFNAPSLCIGEIPLKLINTELGGQLRWHIVLSVVAGAVVAFPYILRQLWVFIKPALKPNEIKSSRIMIFWMGLLFITGILFGYYVILPLTVVFLANYQLNSEIKNFITISSYISSATMLPLSIGLVFELPVLVFFMSKIGLLSVSFLKKNRKFAIVIVLLIAGIITPSTDMFTQLLVSFPLYALYELSIIVAKRVERKKKSEELAG
ncbi:MAG: twin-arginine translocase subunit TatC [Bacteroidota bacterium]